MTRNIRLIGGPADGQVISLADVPPKDNRSKKDRATDYIPHVEAKYQPTGHFEPFTNNELYLFAEWKEVKPCGE